MRSTGEVLGIAQGFGEAFYKAQEAAKVILPQEGTVLISVNSYDKPEVVEVAKGLYECGLALMATGKTYDMIVAAGLPATKIAKLNEGRPNILDEMTNQNICMIVNTPSGKKAAIDDSYIRKSAVKYKIPYITTMAAAKATIEGIKATKENSEFKVKSLQEFHEEIN